VRVNPAFESMLGPEETAKWRAAAEELLSRDNLRAVDVLGQAVMVAAGSATHRQQNQIPIEAAFPQLFAKTPITPSDPKAYVAWSSRATDCFRSPQRPLNLRCGNR
jgi:hypothetical protein